MESIPKDEILEYNPDTMVAVRSLYNLEKPGQMDQAVDLLDAWVQKQSHFLKKDFSREYLERVIILLKGSVERAKAQLDKICTLRTLLPEYFNKYDPRNDLRDVIKDSHVYIAILPKLTPDNYRFYVMKFTPNKQFTANICQQLYMYNVITCEYMKAHDYCDGIIAILDYRDVNIVDFVSALNLTHMKQVATITLEGYDTRAKNFYIISNSKAIEMLVKVVKQMLSEKLAKRVVVLKTAEEILDYVPKEYLPSDYGGYLKPLAEQHDKLLDVLSSKENMEYLKEMSKATTVESCRNNSKFNEDLLGLSGTFRTLDFD